MSANKGRKGVKDHDGSKDKYNKHKSAPSKSAPRKNERTGGLLGMTAGTGSEKKYNDITIAITALPLNSGASITLLNGVIQGTDANQRVGRKAIWKSFLIRLVLSLNGTTPATSTYRIMLVVDKQANAAAPAIGDILATTDFTAVNNLANRARFVVLWDRKGTCAVGGDNAMVVEELFLRKDLTTIYSGTAATIGSIASGAVYLVCFGVLGANGLGCNGNCRSRFEDP